MWSVFIGAAACYKRKMHIGIDMLINLLPIKIREIVNLLLNLFMVILNGFIFYLSYIYVQASYVKPTPVLGISSAYVSSSLLVGFGLMTFYALKFFINDLIMIIKKI
ncbi:Tripartite ATP-independent transporter, DctQ component [Anaerobranca californiensis DSM 14826]|uniref:Tripartite ATP-independent transporter, DctQ component n=1 Tax=Anaerobranca californiensis DSM 14826 TaxID=1120989 RepID=A0A1M6RCP8_9FIRM|nr:Tripartite ATP-independent transporter, DctQ component [Anaerobranca californiensis DSM 14826]